MKKPPDVVVRSFVRASTILQMAVATLALNAGAAGAAVLYVDDGAAAAGADGTMTRPYPSLQQAIDAAANGDDLRVAAGSYGPIAVNAKELHLFGGYAADFGSRDPSATPSVLQGSPAGPSVELFEAASSVVDGFVIRGGARGVFIDADFQSTTNRPLIQGNVIEDNGVTTEVGGGVLALNCDAVVAGNTIRNNRASRGPAVAAECNSIEVRGNVVEGNVAHDDHGGGLYLTGPQILVRDNIIRGNDVGTIIGYGWGGGAVVFGVGTIALFQGNVWTDNHAMSVGSAALVDDGAVATFEHDLFYANRCTTSGGAALYVDGYDVDVSSRVTLENVTIAAHRCPNTTGNAIYVEAQSTVVLHNSIVWDNGGDDFIADATSMITGTYTLSQEALPGEGNLSADPLFFDPSAGDFHVRSTRGRFDPSSGDFVMDAVDSPTIDVGDPASSYEAEPAPNGLRVNLGHTGNTAQASMGAPGGVPFDGGPRDSGGPDAGVRADGSVSTDASTPGGTDDSGCGCSDGRRGTTPHLGIWLLALLFIGRRRR